MSQQPPDQGQPFPFQGNYPPPQQGYQQFPQSYPQPQHYQQPPMMQPPTCAKEETHRTHHRRGCARRRTGVVRSRWFCVLARCNRREHHYSDNRRTLPHKHLYSTVSKIGDAVTVGTDWSVTINSAKTSHGKRIQHAEDRKRLSHCLTLHEEYQHEDANRE